MKSTKERLKRNVKELHPTASSLVRALSSAIKKYEKKHKEPPRIRRISDGTVELCSRVDVDTIGYGSIVHKPEEYKIPKFWDI